MCTIVSGLAVGASDQTFRHKRFSLSDIEQQNLRQWKMQLFCPDCIGCRTKGNYRCCQGWRIQYLHEFRVTLFRIQRDIQPCNTNDGKSGGNNGWFLRRRRATLMSWIRGLEHILHWGCPKPPYGKLGTAEHVKYLLLVLVPIKAFTSINLYPLKSIEINVLTWWKKAFRCPLQGPNDCGLWSG